MEGLTTNPRRQQNPIQLSLSSKTKFVALSTIFNQALTSLIKKIQNSMHTHKHTPKKSTHENETSKKSVVTYENENSIAPIKKTKLM
jgi:hypothetical protein